MKHFDLSLYLVTDASFLEGRDWEKVIGDAVNGGVTMVQLREKEASTRLFYERALQMKRVTKAAGIPLIINDRLDIALAVDAEGLHIGQSDLPYYKARKLLGNTKIIGLSVENIDQAREANHLDVDYIGISPVFNTFTKTDIQKPFGLEGIHEISLFSNHPMVGIGGIDSRNAHQVIKAGAHGIAVVSAILGASDPKTASQELINQIQSK